MDDFIYIFNVKFKESYLEGCIRADSMKHAKLLLKDIPFEATIEQTDYEDSSFLNGPVRKNQLLMKKELNLFNDYGALTINLIYEEKHFPLVLEICEQLRHK